MPRGVTDYAGEGTTSSLYGYDADSVRAYKRTFGSEELETFYLDDAYQRTRVPGSSGVDERVIVFAGGDAVAEVVRHADQTTDTFFLHENHLGSVDAITGEGGELVEGRTYEPFGKRRDVSPVGGNVTHRDYTGHELDPEFGLVNMKARFYDPEIGRFLGPDPIVADAGWSQGVNAYSYVNNNPMNWVDPLGLQADCGPDGSGPSGRRSCATCTSRWSRLPRTCSTKRPPCSATASA